MRSPTGGCKIIDVGGGVEMAVKKNGGSKYTTLPALGNLSERWAKRRWHMESFRKFLDEYKRNGCNPTAAARRIGANGLMVRRWREEMPWFAAEMDEIADAVFHDAASTVYKKRGKLATAMWLLTNHAKGHELGFGKKLSLEEKREATLTMRLEIEQLKSTYSREELEQLQQLLSKAPSQRIDDTEGTEAGADRGDAGGGIVKPLH